MQQVGDLSVPEYLTRWLRESVMNLSPGYLRSIRLRYGQGHHPVFFNDFLMDRLKMMKPRVAVTTYANYEIVITRRR